MAKGSSPEEDVAVNCYEPTAPAAGGCMHLLAMQIWLEHQHHLVQMDGEMVRCIDRQMRERDREGRRERKRIKMAE